MTIKLEILFFPQITILYYIMVLDNLAQFHYHTRSDHTIDGT